MHSESHLDDLSNAEANRVFWDAASTSYFEKLVAAPNVVRMYREVTAKVLARMQLDPETTALMDFACGNGAFSETLSPNCRKVVGVDISQGMVDSYNARMQDLRITNARALRTELKLDDPLLVGEIFDVIYCAQSYKHIEDNVAITRVLSSYLKPNGVLLVVDVIRGKDAVWQVMGDVKSIMHDASLVPPKNLMSRMGGYSENDMRTIFEEAGLVDFTFEEVFEKGQDGNTFALFLAKGARPDQ